MPDPTQRTVPKGQPKGEAQEQQDFEAQTAPLVEAAPTPAGAAVVPQATEDTFEIEEAPPDEAPSPNMVDLEEGPVELDSVLFGPSQRPDEPVTAGILGAAQSQRMTDLLLGMVQRGFSTPDVIALAGVARNLDL